MSEASQRRLETALAALVARVVDSVPQEHRTVARTYFDLVAPEDLVGRDDQDLRGLVTQHVALAAARRPATAAVAALAPSATVEGWHSPHTVVQVVTDDMPFLVDSVSAELSRESRGIHLVIHPIYWVRRDANGALIDVAGLVSSGEAPEGYAAESWMCFEVDRETDEPDLRSIERSLRRVLEDVRVATEDSPRMRAQAQALADRIDAGAYCAASPEERDQVAGFLRWLADDHFTFTGYTEYRYGPGGATSVPGSGLGVLRGDTADPDARADRGPNNLMLVTKGAARSSIHRAVFVDHIAVRVCEDGKVVGEHRFLGLYAASAYTQSVFDIPVVATVAGAVVDRLGLAMTSHSGKDLVQFLETYPRDQLFQMGVDELEATARGVLQLQERRQVRVFAHNDVMGRFASVLVYFPRDRYNTEVRLRMEQVLRERYGADSIDFSTRLTESVLARLHFEVRIGREAAVPEVDINDLEAALATAARFWQDDLAEALIDVYGEEEAVRVHRRWVGAFPSSFQEHVTPHDAVGHIARLEALTEVPSDEVSVAMTPDVEGVATRRFVIYRAGGPITLSAVLPMLHDLGVDVVDERAHELRRPGVAPLWMYDFGITFDDSNAPDPDTLEQRFCETFRDAWAGRVDSDGFNALVISAGLSSRNVAVVRAYAAYLRQAGTPFSQGYLQQVLRANPTIVRLLVALFRARFDPQFAGDREQAEVDAVAKVKHALESVASLDHDRIVRSAMALVRATIRTNVFQTEPDGRPRRVMAFKLDPRRVPDLPLPVPMFEVWVFAPRVEGIHLRFAQVARGGLRWSDRLEDFRTEVLGLVKAQMVKNTVIVPSGAKGGFVVKRGPEPSDRDAWLAEGVACYQMFIGALLDITDNLVDGAVRAPELVVRHDADDPYLVVAADKGTATFSDIANAISLERGFWMGDAFASGGSVGYDHKAMGITARGAWESVKRHFLELGIDCQSQDFTAVGVGDMSGDVFGNGMLLSRHTRLLAAFDHRHIFLDPDPDAARAFEERARLFALPRSSWADYDATLISAGGGVYPRSAKSVPVTAQVRAVLGIQSDAEEMTPSEFISHILRADVGLLWNGGIGTYVKASTETNSQVGDKANDSLRVDGRDLRARVVGEGGNLGCTQLGRIEAARAGVRLNTDAIDNSAGVDTSDHEVNIKILLNNLGPAALVEADRVALLAAMTDEVGSQVLVDNYRQNVILEQGRANAPEMLTVHERLMTSLEGAGLLNRAVEYLPTPAATEALRGAGLGLTSPELAVLMAYVKIDLKRVDAVDTVFDEPWCDEVLRQYFPSALRDRFGAQMQGHPLRRQIVATVLANELVNRGGITFVHRCAEETSADNAQILRAFQVAKRVFRLDDVWGQIEALDGAVSAECQVRLYLDTRRLLDRATRWFLQARGGRLDVQGEVDRFAGHVAELGPRIPDMLKGVEHERFQAHADSLTALGAPEALARRVAALLDEFSVLDIVDNSVAAGTDVGHVTELYFALSEHFEVDRMLHHITALPRGDRWSSNARSALRSDLYAALAGLTSAVMRATPPGEVQTRIARWEAQFSEGVGRTRATLGEIATAPAADLATLSVALRALRTLVGQAGA